MGHNFKEVVETVIKTKKMRNSDMHNILGVTAMTYHKWKKYGVPVKKRPLVMHMLRKVLFDDVHIRENKSHCRLL